MFQLQHSGLQHNPLMQMAGLPAAGLDIQSYMSFQKMPEAVFQVLQALHLDQSARSRLHVLQ